MEKSRIDLEVRNGVIDPDDEEVITKVAEKLEDIFGKPKMDEILENWDAFSEMMRKKDEEIEPFMLKFDTAEAALRAVDCPLDKKILSLILLKAINVDKHEKRNIVSNLNMESESLYEDLKSSIRLNKGSLVEGVKKKPTEKSDDEALYTDTRKQGYHQQNFRGRAKSDSYGRQQFRQNRNFSAT